MNRRGFTLIEVLVTIGIIAVLAGILVPIILNTRQTTTRVNCQSNMRQIVQAVMQYAADNNNLLPFSNWDGSPNTTGGAKAGGPCGHGWLYTLANYRTNFTPASLNGSWSQPYPSDGVKTGVLWPYINNKDIYRCPADNQSEFYRGTQTMTSYLMNGAQVGYGEPTSQKPLQYPTDWQGFALRQFINPTYSVLFWEALEQLPGSSGAPWNDGSSYPGENALSTRHETGANVSYFDCHVEWSNQADWNAALNDPKKGRLWCSPFTANGH